MNPILENTLSYTHIQFYMVSHFLTLGYAAMACGFVYFAMTLKLMPIKQQMANILSMVVMVSAFFILRDQSLNWSSSFRLVDGIWVASDKSSFSNAYRYLNWLIDVPMLLTALFFGLNQAGKSDFMRKWIIFVIAGVLMIITGYIGQFYQLTDHFTFHLWGAISTVFFVIILWQVPYIVYPAAKELPAHVQGLTKSIFWLFLILWTLYPLAYAVPYFIPSAWGVVLKQGLFTVADIGSKVIYGIVLTQIGLKMAEHPDKA